MLLFPKATGRRIREIRLHAFKYMFLFLVLVSNIFVVELLTLTDQSRALNSSQTAIFWNILHTGQSLALHHNTQNYSNSEMDTTVC